MKNEMKILINVYFNRFDYFKEIKLDVFVAGKKFP